MQCCFLQALQHVHFQDLPEDFPACLILRSISLLLNVIKLLSKKPSWTHPHRPNEEGVFNFDSISRWCSCIHPSSLCVCTQVRGGYLMKHSGNRTVLWLNVVELTCLEEAALQLHPLCGVCVRRISEWCRFQPNPLSAWLSITLISLYTLIWQKHVLHMIIILFHSFLSNYFTPCSSQTSRKIIFKGVKHI